MGNGGDRRAAGPDPEWFRRQADMIRVMANPKRLMILDILKGGQKTVTEISSALGMSLPNASQHLRVMRAQHIVRPERDGHAVRYEVTSPVLGQCCGLVRDLLVDQARGERPPRREVGRSRASRLPTRARRPFMQGVRT